MLLLFLGDFYPYVIQKFYFYGSGRWGVPRWCTMRDNPEVTETVTIYD
jgi:hypothetical protein